MNKFALFASLLVHISLLQAQTSEEWLARAEIKYNEKNYLSSIHDTDTSIRLKPQNNPRAYYFRAYAQSNLGYYHEAINDLSKVIEVNPTDLNLLGDRAKLYLEIKSPDLAIADINRILELNPNHAGALYYRAAAYEMQWKKELAITDLRQIQTFLPNNTEVMARLRALQTTPNPLYFGADGLSYDLVNDQNSNPAFITYKTRIQQLKKTLTTESDYEETLSFIYISLFSPPSQDNPTQFYKSQTRTFDLYRVLESCINNFPNNYFCQVLNHEQYVTVTNRISNYNDSDLLNWTTSNFTQVCAVIIGQYNLPDSHYLTEIYNARGHYYFGRDNFKMALDDFEKAVELADSTQIAEAIKNRFLAHQALGNFDAALNDFEKAFALKLSGKRSAVIIRKLTQVELYNQMQKPDQALRLIRELENSATTDHQPWQLQLQKAIALRIKGQYQAALTQIDQVVAEYPNAFNAKLERAKIYRTLGKIDLAYADEAEYQATWLNTQ